jgi:RNA polymerase sigma factor (sigma-70 family)
LARLVAASHAMASARELDHDWPELVATVHRQMRSVVGPGRDLEDLTQTALEQVLRGLERYEGRAALSTFTYRICAHVAMNHWRWWRRWLKKFELGLDGRPEPSASVGEPNLVEERARRLRRALERLEPTRRLTLTLVDLEGKTAVAVAEILECPEPTVRSRLRQARIELAAILRQDPYFEGGGS